MTKNQIDTMKNKIEQLKLNPGNFGYTGELYIEKKDISNDFSYIIEHCSDYFVDCGSYICNRTENYYSSDLADTIQLYSSTKGIYEKLLTSEISGEGKRLTLFTITEYLMMIISKLIDIQVIHKQSIGAYYNKFLDNMNSLSATLVQLMFEDEPNLNLEFIEAEVKTFGTEVMQSGVITTREYVEMDHKLILFRGFLLILEELPKYDLIVSPLLGGAMTAPMFIGFYDYFNSAGTNKEMKAEFIKYGQYDSNADLTNVGDNEFDQQIERLTSLYSNDSNILIADDSIGSGGTCSKIKEALSSYFKDVEVHSVETYWFRKLFQQDKYVSFKSEEVELLSPFCARHFINIDAHIKTIKELKNSYLDNFVEYNRNLNCFYDYELNEEIMGDLLEHKMLNKYYSRAQALVKLEGNFAKKK